jgi:LAO/AO transport system kinase
MESNRPSEADSCVRFVDTLARSAKPHRHVIGITGPPGVGKSSLIGNIIAEYRERRATVGAILVDPSSPRSDGALLADRARVRADCNDEGIFIRSMAAGRHLGGLALKTRHVLTVFEAVYDVILIETVGVGQSETEIDTIADTIAFIVQPGTGDLMQFMKAGIMEIPHVLVINKADQKDGARKTQSDLTLATAFNEAFLDGWRVQVLMTSAVEHWGHRELADLFDSHRQFLQAGNLLAEKRRKQGVSWVYTNFREQYGSFGVELLGGEEAVRDFIEGRDGSNPLAALRALRRAYAESCS